MKTCFGMVNVVWYDGYDAYVSKFILETDKMSGVTPDAKERTEQYMSGNGEILKYHPIEALSFADIKRLEESGTTEEKAAVDRFSNMYFMV